MITVEQADAILAANLRLFESVRLPLAEAFGLILKEDICADRDLPPFDRVTMDGVAIDFSSWQKGRRIFSIQGTQKAGSPALTLRDKTACIAVMTGAMLPEGCDCIVPIEDTTMVNGQAQLRTDLTLTRLQNVHPQASDCTLGTVLLKKGCVLLSPQIAVAAAVGRAEILVARMPKIAVIGTGDELVAIDQPAEPYQSRQSNAYAMQSALFLNGYRHVTRFHLRDDPQELKKRLAEILKAFDVLVLSGGVSAGQYDYVPGVLNALGVEVLLHKVSQRPGKPLWCGRSKDGKPVFALPGNPVSTQICLYRYVLPYLKRCCGIHTVKAEFAQLQDDVDTKTELTSFLPVHIETDTEGRLWAAPVSLSGSGSYAALVDSDGFIELPAKARYFLKGTLAVLLRW